MPKKSKKEPPPITPTDRLQTLTGAGWKAHLHGEGLPPTARYRCDFTSQTKTKLGEWKPTMAEAITTACDTLLEEPPQ